MEKLFLKNMPDMIKIESCKYMMVIEIKWQKSALNVIYAVERAHVHVLCAGFFLHGKTVAISKRPIYILKMCKKATGSKIHELPL